MSGGGGGGEGVVASVGNLSPAMGARNQVGIGLSYWPATLCSLATQFQTMGARNRVGIGL